LYRRNAVVLQTRILRHYRIPETIIEDLSLLIAALPDLRRV